MKNKLLFAKIYILMLAVVMIFLPRLVCVAGEDFTSDYSQKEFNDDDGFDSSNINCICQSTSGYIWLGTGNGLYRYDGSEYTLYTMDSNTDGSIYAINCILLNSDGDLYVGTDNYGLFIYNNGVFNRVAETYDMNISTINNMYEDGDKAIWLATSQGVYVMDEEGVSCVGEEEIGNVNVGNIGGFENRVYAVANSDTLITITGRTKINIKSKTDFGIEDINSMYVAPDGTRYYGSVGRTILKISSASGKELINTGGIRGINKICGFGERIWVLSDEGVAYFVNGNKELKQVTGLLVNESMSDMIMDYEGNYWFASYRKGLVYLERSKFENTSMKYGLGESIVNCALEYGNKLYIGTDDGLSIIDNTGKLVTDNDLVNLLQGISIRDMYVDSNNELWICTYRIYGVIKLDRKGAYTFYNRSESNLVSNSVNCIIEIDKGHMAIGTENGISILKDNEIIRNYTRADGLENTDIKSLYVGKDRLLYAGSNGGGMYTIDMESNIKRISLEEGVRLNTVSTIVGGDNGLWIGTNNGLYYQEGVVRQIAAVDSTNSIHDIIIDDSGYMWIFGSKGIYRYYENDLLSTAQPECLNFTKNDGIISSITEFSSNSITKDGIVYVCCDEGLCSIDPENVYTNEVEPKVRISSVVVDGTEYKFSDLDGKIEVPGNTNRITIKFSVLSYVNREGIVVKYYLDGFETEPRTISGSDVLNVEYTNLEGGNYRFVLSAENADGIECNDNLTFIISKKLVFWETDVAKTIVICATLLLLLIIIISIRGIAHVIKRKNEQVEELSKKNEEAEKSNQAKNDYVNYLSHEIRAPLNTILGVSEMVIRNPENISDEQLPKYQALYDAGYEILGIVDGISRLSNLKDGSIELVEKEYAVSDVIYDLTHQFKEMINTELVDIKANIEDDLPSGLIGDVTRVKELISNIFTRAASTTKEGSIYFKINWRPVEPDMDLTLELENDNNPEIWLDLTISDTGIGVQEDRLETLFDLDDSYGKSDIGKFDISIKLAIAKQLIHMMDGEVKAESTYGAGTTITLSIKQKVFDYSYLNYNLNKKKEIARRDSNSIMWLPDTKVLIVDESELGLQVEKTLLEAYGITCDTVTSGFDAIDKVMVNAYDMVFIDTIMTVMDGKDTVREIRGLEGEEYKKMPIIAMSVNTVDASRETIIESGFDEVLVKPIELDDVETILRMYISPDKIKEKTTDYEENDDISKYIEASDVLKKYIAVDEALKQIGGSFDNFNTIIVNYKAQYEGDIMMLQDYIDDDVRKYKNVIHNVKSSSSNIGAFIVERKAANLLSAINIGNMQYAKDNTREFVSLMKDMFKAIDLYLSMIMPGDDNNHKEFSDSINRGKLKELRAYLRANEKGPVTDLVADLDSFEYGDIDTEFFNALKMTIESMDYEGASEIIDQYLNSI